MGLAFLLAPIAAFVEPDEEELFGTERREAKASRGARIRILAAGVTSNFLVAGIAMALFFGPVIGAISPLDRVVAADIQNGSAGDLAGFQRNMVLLQANGRDVNDLEQLYRALTRVPSELRVLYEDRQADLALKGDPVRGIMVASIFEGSPASEAGMPPRTVISGIDGLPITGLEDFRMIMNSTNPGQEITVATADGGSYQLRLASKPDGTSLIGIGISGNALYLGGVTFQEFPAGRFLSSLEAIPRSGFTGLAALLSLPFAGIPGFTEKGFPGFSGWITNVFQPAGWAAPLGPRFFWIANLLLWVGWINLYAGLFNCLPAVPLDGGHIFRDLIQGGFERVVNVRQAERLTRTVVALLAWLVLTSLLITVFAPLSHGL
jgi:membrane-associated protease RseP (regulator of RpoE activity)